jgi:hypothetical protein
MEVNGQIDAPAILLAVRTGSILQPVWTWWLREKPLPENEL